ncbi:hypothetical protein N9R43_01230 [bacterium]|nr:hypothetical protein [bacterium]
MDNFVINNLTKQQVKLLDKMWSLDTADDFQRFLATQTPDVAREVRTLQEMMLIAHVDDVVVDTKHYTLANEMLRSIQK